MSIDFLSPMKDRAYVVSHFHWDRAWYLPFESFRLRLVRTVDKLLDILETDPSFRCFTFDGQSVLLEDYLELRPENRSRIASLVEARKLFIGPWYTLPDLFLAGGEAVIRNLQIGRKLCRSFGDPMSVGYVPDSFGHFAQLPQILQGFGIDSFLFMRGLDTKTKKELGAIFDWVAPDGSAVLAVYLPRGYLGLSAWGHPADWGRFDGHDIDSKLAESKLTETLSALSATQKERSFLLPNGCDHMPPQPEIPELIRSLQSQKAEIAHTGFEEFISALRSEQVVHGQYQGDLLGNADHPILSSVYSTRQYLKIQNQAAQHQLARIAEPIAVLMESLGSSLESRSFLKRGWKLLLKNHAHDDICGCSVDPVHRENETQFSAVQQIARELATERLEFLKIQGLQPAARSGSLKTDLFFFNPHPFRVAQECEAEVLLPNPNGEWADPTPEQNLECIDSEGRTLESAVLSSTPHTVRSRFLETSWGRSYRLRVNISVPPLGYEIVHVFEKGAPPKRIPPSQELRIENNFVEVSAKNGAISLLEKKSGRLLVDFLSLELEADSGDTYSFGPTPSAPKVTGVCQDIRRSQEHPRQLDLSYLVQDMPVRVSLRLGIDAQVECIVQYENTIPNSRLRLLYRTGVHSKSAWTEHAFRWVEHIPIAPQDLSSQKPTYPGERLYPTRPQGDLSLVDDGQTQAWIANRGLTEYEPIPHSSGMILAITLHRAIGLLSVSGGGLRACQAGPALATPEAQCLRSFTHVLSLGFASSTRAAILQKARVHAHPLHQEEMPYLPHVTTSGIIPRQASLLSFENPSIQLSALGPAPTEGTVFIRLYNSDSQAQTASLKLGFEASHWSLSDLDALWNPRLAQTLTEKKLQIELQPHQIVTLLFKLRKK